MTKLITLRCSGLQWVISYHILLCTLFSDLLLVLHPCHKLLYFRTAGQEDEWITSAEEIICTQYHQSYGALDTSWVISQETQFSKTKACVFKLLLYIKVLLLVMQTTLSSKNIFDNLPALQAPRPAELHDELERCLSLDPERVADALAWWYEKKKYILGFIRWCQIIYQSQVSN